MDDTTGRVGARRDQDETEIRTQEIREEIAQTRIEMSETIEAIEERLRPSNLVAQAGETVRNAATEKVKDMANTAERAADRVMETSFAQTVRANPVPVAMIGIGTAWLLMKGRPDEASRWRRRGYGQSRELNAYETGGNDWGREATASVVGTTGYADYSGAAAGEAARTAEFGGEIRPYYRDTRRTVNVERVMRDNPLLVGAAAALVGVAIGMSLPASETENRVMGEARDTVVDRAREAAGEAAEKVQEVAGKAADAATQVRDAAKRAAGTPPASNRPA
jgi:hypothetical protein